VNYKKLLKEGNKKINEDTLYRKVDDKYIPVSSIMYHGDPKEGIYIISKIKNGTDIKWITEKLEDLPEVMNIASYIPYEYAIAKEYHRLSDDLYRKYPGVKVIPLNDILDMLKEIIKK